MKKTMVLASMFVCLLWAAAGVSGTPPQPPQEVYGSVTADGSAVPGSSVVFQSSEASFSTSTDSEGDYQISIPYSTGREDDSFSISVDGEDTGKTLTYKSGDISEIDLQVSPEESGTGDSGDSGSDSSGSGGTGSGGFPGGGGTTGPEPGDDEENDSSGQQDNVGLEVGPSELSFRLASGETVSKELEIVNTGNVDLEVDIDSSGLEDLNDIESGFDLEAGETETVDIDFGGSGSEIKVYTGSLTVSYGNDSLSVPVNVDVFDPEPAIKTNISNENGGISYSIDVEGVDENEQVTTEVYNDEGDLIYSRNYTTNSSSTEIQGRLESDLNPGEYTFESQVSGTSAEATSTKFQVVEVENEVNTVLILVGVVIAILILWKLSKEIRKKKEINKELEKHLNNTKSEMEKDEPTEDSEKAEEISEIIKESISQDVDPEVAKELYKSLESTNSILERLKNREEVPKLVIEKEEEAMNELSDENYSEASKLLEQIIEILDRSEEKEGN